jgi:hypothetical protein
MIRDAEPRLALPSKIPRREFGSVAARPLLSVKHLILSLYVFIKIINHRCLVRSIYRIEIQSGACENH